MKITKSIAMILVWFLLPFWGVEMWTSAMTWSGGDRTAEVVLACIVLGISMPLFIGWAYLIYINIKTARSSYLQGPS